MRPPQAHARGGQPCHSLARSPWEWMSRKTRAFLGCRGLGSNVVREVPYFCKAIAQEGLQGGKGDTYEVEQPQHIYDPGIHQEPESVLGCLYRESAGRDLCVASGKQPPTASQDRLC